MIKSEFFSYFLSTKKINSKKTFRSDPTKEYKARVNPSWLKLETTKQQQQQKQNDENSDDEEKDEKQEYDLEKNKKFNGDYNNEDDSSDVWKDFILETPRSLRRSRTGSCKNLMTNRIFF